MKNIQVTFNEESIATLEKLAGESNKTRTALIREAVKTDNIHTVAKNKLTKYLGTLDPEIMKKISKKIILSLGLESALEEFTACSL